MGKKLSVSPAELDAIFALSNLVPPDKISDGNKYSTFRRAIRIGLTAYNKGISDFMDVIREDYKKLDENKKKKESEQKDAKKPEQKILEKEIDDLNKAIAALNTEAQDRLKKYQEENKNPIEVNFDEEAFLYMQNLFSLTAKDILKVQLKDKDGKDIELYDANRADALFEILDKAQ